MAQILLYSPLTWGLLFKDMLARMFPLFRTVAPLVVTLSVTAGCSTQKPAKVRPAESSEKYVFDSMSAFYCSQHRWPRTWDEFVHFDGLSKAAHHAVGEFLDPVMASPRAILLTVKYKNIQGVDRKVTFVAPPDCSGAKGDEISIAGGRITFNLGKEFSLLGGEAVKAKWKGGPYPDAAWQDATQGIFVTVSFGEVQVTPDQLGTLKEELEATYESSIESLEWVERSLASEEDPPKLVHELKSGGPSGQVLSYAVTVSFDERLLTFSVAGPAMKQKQIERVADVLRRSLTLR